MKHKNAIKNENGVVKRRMLSGAAVLAVGGIIAKLLGALYRIPLTNILGAEGMGMYQLVFPVYALFMTLSVAGIPTALSRIVAEKKIAGEPAKKYLASAMLILAGLSTLAAILTFSLSGYLAAFQGNVDTHGGFKIIAPAIILVGLIAGFRGWFQGEMYMIPTAASNIIEQVVKLALGIALSLLLIDRGVVYAVYGALAGITVSEFFALAYLFITYLVRGRKLQKEKLRITRDEARGMFKIAFPIALVAVLLPLSSFFDSIIIVNVLKWSGLSQSVATSQYGLLSGPVNSLVNMPIAVIMSLAIAIVPAVSASRMQRDISAIMLKSSLSIKLTYLFGVPCAFFFAVFAPRLLALIYPTLSAEQLIIASNILRITCANVVMLSAMQIYVSLLQALDRTKYAVLSLVFAIIVKIVLSIVLTRYIGIIGSAIASLSMAAVALLGVNISFYKTCGLHLEKNVGLNLLCGVIMALTGVAATYFIQNTVVMIAVGFIVCAVVYVWLALLMGLVDREEIQYLPMRRLIAKLHRFIRFWEYRDET